MFRRDNIHGTLEDVVKLFSGLFTKEEIFKLQENIIVKLLKCFISICVGLLKNSILCLHTNRF